MFPCASSPAGVDPTPILLAEARLSLFVTPPVTERVWFSFTGVALEAQAIIQSGDELGAAMGNIPVFQAVEFIGFIRRIGILILQVGDAGAGRCPHRNRRAWTR